MFSSLSSYLTIKSPDESLKSPYELDELPGFCKKTGAVNTRNKKFCQQLNVKLKMSEKDICINNMYWTFKPIKVV